MKKSLIEFRTKFLEKLHILLVSQWKILGIPFQDVKVKPSFVIDPEALLLLSLSLFRFYPREFDEVINWLNFDGNIINIQRLKNISKKLDFSSLPILSAVANFLSERQKQPKWKGLTGFANDKKQPLFYNINDFTSFPTFGDTEKAFLKHNYKRGKIQLRKHTKETHDNANNCLTIKLRRLFGVNVRSEIIGYLLLTNRGNSNKIANECFFLQKTVYEILKELEKGGFIFSTQKGKANFYKIEKQNWIKLLTATPPLPAFLNVVKIFYAYDLILKLLLENIEKDTATFEYLLRKNFIEFTQKLGEADFDFYITKHPTRLSEEEIYNTILKSIDNLLN